ncbi:MAG TPA: VLRF1 family aeRF1-type release factor [Micromonosporaceae bacterium]
MVTMDRQRLRSLATLTDEVAVVSVYVGADLPVANPTVQPAQIRLDRDLAAVERGVQQASRRTLNGSLAARLADVEAEMARLYISSDGLGRALFAPMSGGEMHVLTVQHALPNEVVLQPTAYIRPLVAAWSQDGATGVAVVSAAGIRLIDLRLGETEPVAELEFTDEADRRLLLGPAASGYASSGFGQSYEAVSQTDLYQRRARDRVRRFLTGVGPRISVTAAKRDWDLLAISGDAELVAAVADGLPAKWPVTVVRLPYELAEASPARVAAAVRDDIAAARRDRAHDLADQIRDAALAGGTGALGLGETLGALQEGRVAHLVLDESRSWSASQAPDGYLVPEGEVPPWATPESLRPEPNVDERMVELAYNTGAEVTLAPPAAVEALADAGGIGARLRW